MLLMFLSYIDIHVISFQTRYVTWYLLCLMCVGMKIEDLYVAHPDEKIFEIPEDLKNKR